ncbi:glycosyltransferase family 2 protein [Mycoplasmopsis columboralis]|uniref:Glycosyl transferase family 2 n=1 Tax=Mycoplasmopsis columboralis TaxID=171282 RepID=A0A449B5R7_9BACT|nr:glycosyltransferase family 2 protein [Mycoplasmopsis columboralis]VEU75915.1 Glycosyl transferase family 2 [Mycoplasmopsis columboralis]
MRLSLISLVGDSERDVDWFLQDLAEQETQDFEVILCIDKNSEAKKILDVISKYKKFFGSRVIAIFNSKMNSYQHNLVSAFRIASGDYVCVLNSDSTIKRHYIKRIIDVAIEHNVDILELKPRLVGSIRWKPLARINLNENLEISKHKEVVAYTYPFIFNKIFKKSLIKKFVKYKPISNNDSKLCVEVNYMLLLSAKTYRYVDKRIIREYYGADIWLNTKNGLQSFAEVENYIKLQNLKLLEEIKYAKYYYLKVVMYGLLNSTTFMYRNFKSKEEIEEKRSELLVEKHEKALEKLESSTEFDAFEKSNLYMIKSSQESDFLRTPISKLKKIRTKILSELE